MSEWALFSVLTPEGAREN